MEEEGTDGMVGAGRDDSRLLRTEKCTWANLAHEVEVRVQEKERALPFPPEKLTTVSASGMRLYVAARNARSIEAQRHTALADITTAKLSKASEGFNIDAQQSNAFVRLAEQRWGE